MIDLEPHVLASIQGHSVECLPRESCGMVVIFKGRQKYVPCRNVSELPDTFVIHHEDQFRAEDMGEVVCYVHSHPGGTTAPSEADRDGVELSGAPWVIVCPETGYTSTTLPTGYRVPLYGREFVHGVSDCYAFVRDAYLQLCGLHLPDFDRVPLWWEKGYDLITENLLKAGFVVVPLNTLRINDGLVMRMGSGVPNHVGILVEDNTLGHHLPHRLSSKDVYGSWLRNTTVYAVRHQSML